MTLVRISKHAKMILELKSKKGGISQKDLLEYAILNTNIGKNVKKK